MRIYGGTNIPGAVGNLLAGNPFGADFVIPQQQQSRPPAGQGPQLPNPYGPTRIFRPGEPGREGAIDVQFRQAMLPGMNLGNAAYFMNQQMPMGFQNKIVS